MISPHLLSLGQFMSCPLKLAYVPAEFDSSTISISSQKTATIYFVAIDARCSYIYTPIYIYTDIRMANGS